MPENTPAGHLVARLQITGTSTEISTQLIYNSSDVKTNGTDYFSLAFTDLYLKSRKLNFLMEINEKERFDFKHWIMNGGHRMVFLIHFDLLFNVLF